MRRLVNITSESVIEVSAEDSSPADFKQKLLLDLKTRPQVLVDRDTGLLAVFLNGPELDGIIKMINSLKSGEDFGVIELAKLWKGLKPLISNLEIKTT